MGAEGGGRTGSGKVEVTESTPSLADDVNDRRQRLGNRAAKAPGLAAEIRSRPADNRG